jgi:predicted amidohydrolase
VLIQPLLTCSDLSFFWNPQHGVQSVALSLQSGDRLGIIGPNGAVVGEPLIDDEGIVYADIDLQKCIQPKQMHDILGHYNRFDIFDLRVNIAPTRKITFIDNHEEFNKR